MIEFPSEMCWTRQTLPSVIFFLAGQIEKYTIQGLYQCSPSRLHDSVKECLSKDGYLSRQVKSNIQPFGKVWPSSTIWGRRGNSLVLLPYNLYFFTLFVLIQSISFFIRSFWCACYRWVVCSLARLNLFQEAVKPCQTRKTTSKRSCFRENWFSLHVHI